VPITTPLALAALRFGAPCFQTTAAQIGLRREQRVMAGVLDQSAIEDPEAESQFLDCGCVTSNSSPIGLWTELPTTRPWTLSSGPPTDGLLFQNRIG
jgi:hypothetical protein